MSIIRISHNKENPYVQLSKKALWDENLSMAAAGLWARCMSRPDNWKFSVNELAKRGKEKHKAIYSVINELINAGYVVRLEMSPKKEGGQFSNRIVEYVFFEFIPTEEDRARMYEEFKKSHRNSPCGDLRSGGCQNAPILNTDPIPIKEYEKYEEGDVSFVPPKGEDFEEESVSNQEERCEIVIPQALVDMGGLGLSTQDQERFALRHSEFLIQIVCEDVYKYLRVKDVKNIAAIMTKRFADYERLISQGRPISDIWKKGG